MNIWDGRSINGRRDFADYLLLFLNPMDVRHKNVEGYKLVMGVAAGIPAPIPAATMTAPTEIREKAIQEFHCALRNLTEQWIDSGKQNGIELPWARSVQFVSPFHSASIENTLNQFWKRHPPTVLFDQNEQVLSTQSILSHSDWVHLSTLSIDRLMEYARDHAIQRFASLMDSPSRYRVFRCEECRLYFTRERMPKKDAPIYKGAFCDDENCKSAAGKRRVEELREKNLDLMVGVAADAWANWKPDRHHGELAAWVTRKVNQRLPAGCNPISHNKTNWFNRHRKEIEAEVERRKHATD
jgi:hypothetical protein